MNNRPGVLGFQGLRGFSCFCGIHMPLRRISANYERGQAEQAAEDAKRRETLEKEQRKVKRKFSKGAR